MKKLSLKDFQNHLDQIHPLEDLIAIEWNGFSKNSKVRCAKCETEYIKKGQNFLDKRKISICKKCFPTQPNIFQSNWEPPQGYSLIEKYNGKHNKILVQHECGFIWKVKPHNLELGHGCPKCSKKVSKGEQKIMKWLEEKNIRYNFQYPLDIDGHHYKMDFFLPDYNYYIEYNGEQHYIPIDHFGGKERLKIQQVRDKEVFDLLSPNLLMISYKDFENIEKILESSTTISKESKPQAIGG